MIYLNELFEKAPKVEIEALCVDSRTTVANSIFFCLKGIKSDGHHHVKQAIENGAKVIVYHDNIDLSEKAIYIRVENVLDVLNKSLKVFYNDPSKDMHIVAVSGASGKTTIANSLLQMLNDEDRCGYIGDLGILFKDKSLGSSYSTPEAIDLHRYLSMMKTDEIETCVIEASTLGIEQGRLDAIRKDVAIFTNLDADHMQMYGSSDEYFFANKLLFDSLDENAFAITNIDDKYGRRMVQDTKAKVVTYAIDAHADFSAFDIKYEKDKTSFVLRVYSKTFLVDTNLIGRFNIYNLLAVIATMVSLGYSINDVIAKCNNLRTLKGYMQRIDLGQNYNVIVDYANTSVGVERVLNYATNVTASDKSIVVVIGSEGGRDESKRKTIGEVLDKYADMIILTEDDSSDENLDKIFDDIIEGIKKKPFITVKSREDAIISAIDLLNSDDTLLILGKGCDKFLYRIFGREIYAGDDVLARKYIKKRMEEENEAIEIY